MQEKIKEIRLINAEMSSVFKGINMHAAGGQIVMIMGPSGAGKTTLLNVLAGLLHLSKGKYEIDERSFLETYPNRNLFRKEKVGYVFQEQELLSEYTVLENILASVSLYRRGLKNRKEWVKRAENLAESLNIKALLKKYPGYISGGERQRTSIARALLKEPELLLCDEPVTALDYEMKQQVMKQVREYTQKTEAVTIVVTHDWELSTYADTLYYLSQEGMKKIENQKAAVLKEMFADGTFRTLPDGVCSVAKNSTGNNQSL